MGGGHGGGMGMGGGMHGGGGWGGGGMHVGGGGWGGMHSGGWSGGARFASIGGPHVVGRSFAGARFAHAGFSHRFAFHNGRFFRHHRRFAFIGAPYVYAGYDDCWRRVWTPYGLQWTNVCYGNYY